MGTYDYQNFLDAVDDQLTKLAEVGPSYLNAEGRDLLSACLQIKAAEAFCPTANDLLRALENDRLSGDELWAARFAFSALNMAASNEENDA